MSRQNTRKLYNSCGRVKAPNMRYCFVSYMRMHVMMSLIILTVNVWTLTVTTPQLVHVNNCDLLVFH
jgi:hypothetical protein